MRFITEFETNDEKYVNGIRKIHKEENLGHEIANKLGWKEIGLINTEGLAAVKHTLEIEAFPMDKWVEFKQKLFMECGTPCPNGVAILEMIKDLEFYTNNKQAVDAITNQQLNK